MSSNLRNHLQGLASTFATSVLEALRSASLEEILAESGGASAPAVVRRGPGRPPAAAKPAVVEAPRAGRRRGGRLSRRSADDIAGLVNRIVELLGQNSGGLRAEQIRDALTLEAKELPRPLAEALTQKRISKEGHKRATTYFASGRGKAPAKPAGRGRPAKKAGKAAAKAAAPKAAKAGRKKGAGRGRRARAPGAESAVAEATV